MIVDIGDWGAGDWTTRLYEYKVWCDFHCAGRWYRKAYYMNFEIDADALLFTLRWQGTS